MKKITPREMKWINKGKYRNLGYNRIEAKGNNSYFYAISNEDFTFKSNHYLNNKDYSIYISISDITYIKLNINDDLSITTSIKGYKVETSIEKNNYINLDNIIISINRVNDNFEILVNESTILKTNLPAAKDAVTFGFLFNNEHFVKIDNIQYIKK